MMRRLLSRVVLRRLAPAAGAGAAGFAFSAYTGSAYAAGTPISAELLKKQNAATSEAVIETLKGNAEFDKLSVMEAQAIIRRDQEDDAKLSKGIELSISRGVLPRITPPHVTQIDVKGKTPEAVAKIITDGVAAGGGKGSVIVLQGMSGTGKGTTASILMTALPKTAAWSNGNVFRTLTLLATTQYGDKVKTNSAEIMTPENVAAWMKCVSFVKKDSGVYDIKVSAPDLGVDFWVSEEQNTKLKIPAVSRCIPSVAEYTQGDVVQFAAKALQQMAADGMNVILEGRGPTVQYVPTDHRYELVLGEEKLLGQRRAAQRVMAGAHALMQKEGLDVDAALTASLRDCLK